MGGDVASVSLRGPKVTIGSLSLSFSSDGSVRLGEDDSVLDGVGPTVVRFGVEADGPVAGVSVERASQLS